MLNKRPDTFPEMLEEIIDWLDLGDEACLRLADLQGISLTLGKGVQRDLKALADLARENPNTNPQSLWNTVLEQNPEDLDVNHE